MAKTMRHIKRFIVEYRDVYWSTRGISWLRSGNEGINGFFLSRKEAQQAIARYGSEDIIYRVRQK
jgi:hypothetical protein